MSKKGQKSSIESQSSITIGSEASDSSCYFSINSSSSNSHACDGWDKPGAKENEDPSCDSDDAAAEHEEKGNW